MTTTQTITVLKIEDHGGEGVCTACGKEGLRWVSILSDGSRVGGECAKKIMGWKPTAKSHAWVTGMHIVAEGVMSPVQYAVLWSNEAGTWSVLSINGVAHSSGPLDWCRQAYDRYMN